MADDKKTVVTEVKKPLIPLPLFIRRRKQKIFRLFLVLIVLAGAGGGYYFYTSKPAKITKGPNNQEFQTVTVEGREFKVPTNGFVSHNPSQTTSKSAVDDRIKQLEDRAASGQATYTDYHALGQLYTKTGNTQKAIENYKTAISKADPKMENYQQFVNVTNDAIKYLEAN